MNVLDNFDIQQILNAKINDRKPKISLAPSQSFEVEKILTTAEELDRIHADLRYQLFNKEECYISVFGKEAKINKELFAIIRTVFMFKPRTSMEAIVKDEYVTVILQALAKQPYSMNIEKDASKKYKETQKAFKYLLQLHPIFNGEASVIT